MSISIASMPDGKDGIWHIFGIGKIDSLWHTISISMICIRYDMSISIASMPGGTYGVWEILY